MEVARRYHLQSTSTVSQTYRVDTGYYSVQSDASGEKRSEDTQNGTIAIRAAPGLGLAPTTFRLFRKYVVGSLFYTVTRLDFRQLDGTVVEIGRDDVEAWVRALVGNGQEGTEAYDGRISGIVTGGPPGAQIGTCAWDTSPEGGFPRVIIPGLLSDLLSGILQYGTAVDEVSVTLKRDDTGATQTWSLKGYAWL
jgi:hypothetical protein